MRSAGTGGARGLRPGGNGRAREVLTSREFADKLGNWRDQARDVAFMIGGPGGLKATFGKMPMRISFGAATWPHKLARAMLVEQIYRAQEISRVIPITVINMTFFRSFITNAAPFSDILGFEF